MNPRTHTDVKLKATISNVYIIYIIFEWTLCNFYKVLLKLTQWSYMLSLSLSETQFYSLKSTNCKDAIVFKVLVPEKENYITVMSRMLTTYNKTTSFIFHVSCYNSKVVIYFIGE